MISIHKGDCREVLRTLPDAIVHCCVTSPPYWGLRDYGTAQWVDGDPSCDHRQSARKPADWGTSGLQRNKKTPELSAGTMALVNHQQEPHYREECGKCGAIRIDRQVGLEPTYQLYVQNAVTILREVWRVLRKDGTLWLNLGDCYATGAGKVGGRPGGGSQGDNWQGLATSPNRMPQPGLKPKDLVGIPWRVAFALQADGWYLRQDIIWSKPNPMPESVRDRCTKAHEYLFLLSKSERYYFNADAIAEPVTQSTIELRLSDSTNESFVPGATPHSGLHRAGTPRVGSSRKELRSRIESRHRSAIPGGQSMQAEPTGTRNRRSVWTVATQPFSEAHFATFPPALIEPCILAGCPKGGTVLDPFAGAGTTGLVADRLARNAVLIELNADYAAMIVRRIQADAGMFASINSEAAE